MEEQQTVIGSRLGIPSTTPKKADGGPAFPHTKAAGSVLLTEGGLSLRDYFAAKALEALIIGLSGIESDAPAVRARALSREAYSYADAMLEMRK